MTGLHDIGVLGSGPAGLAIATACSQRGASVTVIAPEPRAGWKPNYCVWADELPRGLEDLAEHFWPEASVATPLGVRTLTRAYVKLGTQALQSFFWSSLRADSVRVVPHRAVRLDHDPDGTTIHTDEGSSHRVGVVIDASGGQSRFVKRVHQKPPAFQTAYGLLLQAPGHDFDAERMGLMDFRPASPGATEPPSFLYVLPLSEGRLFVEETSLARRPAFPTELLRVRLESRLVSLGLERCTRIGEEYCSIPMGLGLPITGQSVVPFGAAASMVHPASGYLIAHVLRKAEPVAASILDGLDSGGVGMGIESGNTTLWPRARRRVWETYGLGLEALVSMNAHQTMRFFDSFFQLPVEDWSGFLAGTLAPTKLGGVMTRLFRGLPASLRWNLLRTSVSKGAAPLARSLLQPGTR